MTDQDLIVVNSEQVAPAYLKVRDISGDVETHRLQPGQITTLGRASTNRIVLRDDICSRHHCELFVADQSWMVRDLNSRNGTLLGHCPVNGDAPLEEGDLLKVGSVSMLFTLQPNRTFAPVAEPLDSETLLPELLGNEAQLEKPAIIRKQRESRFSTLTRADQRLRDRLGRELATLYRLASQMGVAENLKQLCNEVLAVLLSNGSAEVGAILIAEQSLQIESADPTPGSHLGFNVVSFHGQAEERLNISRSLSEAVLAGSAAILGSVKPSDGGLGFRDSLGRMRARSVLCAPVRHAEQILGLIHLYALNPDEPLTADDLEFTLAVADQLGSVIGQLTVRNVLAADLNRANLENRNLRQQLRFTTELVGRSTAIETLRREISQVAPTRATVLIRGESGVGKELIARAIHSGSDRSHGPFVCMNCAALTESLLESELFGHEKGSFTGATARKVGKFEAADGGSLFLDEVGEMSLAIQAKFLRVLEGHAFERVGGNQSLKANVRVVAATNRNLEEAVENGLFRRDLYFRLHVVVLHAEPLRNRPGDIELLANHFREQIGLQAGRRVRGFSSDALQKLQNYDWPGNVRELQNTIERAIILSVGDIIGADDIRLSRLGLGDTSPVVPAPSREYREIPLGLLEKEHILATLAHTEGNKSRAAQILGIERSTLDRKLKRYDD